VQLRVKEYLQRVFAEIAIAQPEYQRGAFCIFYGGRYQRREEFKPRGEPRQRRLARRRSTGGKRKPAARF